jgi:DNA-binding MarR family transcriptional regulator
VTKLLDRMEELGVVDREFGKVPGDRRAILVSLTPRGEQVVSSMSDGLLEYLDPLRAALATVVALIDEAQGAVGMTGTTGTKSSA